MAQSSGSGELWVILGVIYFFLPCFSSKAGLHTGRKKEVGLFGICKGPGVMECNCSIAFLIVFVRPAKIH